MILLVYFQADNEGKDPQEYIALVEDGEDLDEYTEVGYTIRGKYEIEGRTWSDNEHLLPLGTFREW